MFRAEAALKAPRADELSEGASTVKPKEAHLAARSTSIRSGEGHDNEAKDKEAQFSSAANGTAAHATMTEHATDCTNNPTSLQGLCAVHS